MDIEAKSKMAELGLIFDVRFLPTSNGGKLRALKFFNSNNEVERIKIIPALVNGPVYRVFTKKGTSRQTCEKIINELAELGFQMEVTF